MSQRAHCWLCRLVLPPEGRTRVCPDCRERYQGLCRDCLLRASCSLLYQATVTIRKGERAPGYPPCLRIPPAGAHIPRMLTRRQQQDYGLPVGIAVLLLAGDDPGDQDAAVHWVSWEQVVALGEVWGARVREVAA